MTTTLVERKLGNGKLMRVDLGTSPKGGGTWPVLVVHLDGAATDIEGRIEEIAPAERKRQSIPAELTHTIGQYGRKICLKAVEAETLRVALDAAIDAHLAAEEARLDAAIPGLSLLRKAREQRGRFDGRFRGMMADEQNDGARPPAAPTLDYDALRRQHPRAAFYLDAEHNSASMSDAVSWGGKDAMAVLEAGGTIEEARAAMSGPIRSTAAYLGTD